MGHVSAGAVRVVAAMSGGVDSSVAAALLKEQGYDVTGVTMRMTAAHGASPGGASRCADPAADAGRVARALGIPHHVVDVSDVFEERVISYFCREYSLGRTPNPCLVCNRYIKFGELVGIAREMGAAYVATGHYARTRFDSSLGRHLLLRGVDLRKDQSYVLYALQQDQLSTALFPLGGMRKPEVRRKAAQLGLPVADKPESQEICFIAQGDYRGFLQERCPSVAREGPIVDTSGRVLGRHRGLAFYTVGQRKGLGLAGGTPLYVLDLDYAGNTLVVGSAPETLRSSCIVSEPNFIPFPALTGEMEVACKIRYRAEAAPAVISPNPDSTVTVTFSTPQRAITPGQAAVFYDGDIVVGGGFIR
ncbi:MAG: tRNA 2-thiouridine(34) synthase MnmA [Bacillota bacterium]